MDFYAVVVAAHVVGAVVLEIGAVGLLATILMLGRPQRAGAASRSVGAAALFDRTVPIGAAVVLASGVYMVMNRWGWGEPWLLTGLVGLLAVAPLSPTLISPSLTRGSTVATPSTSTKVLIATGVLAGVSLGELLLMLAKPSGVGVSVVILVSAAAAGVAIAYGYARLGRER